MTHIIRDAIKLRYQLIPYLYQLSIASSQSGMPVIRPLVLEFQSDTAVYQTSFDFMLGPCLLVSSVTEEGQTTKDVYLPKGTQWCDFWTGKWYIGGENVQVSVPLSQHGALFAKEGSMIPTGKCMQYVGAEQDDLRVFLCFPPLEAKDHVYESVLVEDDGISLHPLRTIIRIQMQSFEEFVQVDCINLQNEFKLPYDTIWFQLSRSDKRVVKSSQGALMTRMYQDRLMYGLNLSFK